MLLTVAGINVAKSVNNIQGHLGALLLWSSEPSEYFDLLTVALELSHLQLSLFVLIVLSLAHMVCLQQLLTTQILFLRYLRVSPLLL